MQRLLEIYRQQFKVTLAVQFQYRVGLAIWMLEEILQPTIYLVVWRTVAGSGEVGGYGAREFAAYYIVLMIVNHFTENWHMWEYEYYIREGKLSAWLLRPVHPIHKDIAANIGYKVLMLAVLLPATIGLTLVFKPVFSPPLWVFPAFVPAILLAAAIAFAVGWVVAMAAFWTVRVSAINQMYFLLMLFASGYIAPLDVLPDALQGLAALLPFRWMLAFPTELVLGRLEPGQWASGLAVQVAWLAASLFALRIVWRAGVRRYGAVGG